MYEELVKRLREHAKEHCPLDGGSGICGGVLANEAADAIEELSRKIENLEALREISSEAEYAIDKHADNLILHMEELISGLKGKPRWIPVTERLPSDELCSYLCYTDKGVTVECLWTNNKYGLGPFDEWGWRLMDVPQYQRVTHWMPLPVPPKEEV